jgi:hypothetical protein
VRQLVLERAAQEFADATANPPHLLQLGPEEGNKVVGEIRLGDVSTAAHLVARRPVEACFDVPAG